MEGMLPSVCATTAVESFFHHRPLAFDTHRLSHAHTRLALTFFLARAAGSMP